jgi:hypothetical protein
VGAKDLCGHFSQLIRDFLRVIAMHAAVKQIGTLAHVSLVLFGPVHHVMIGIRVYA